MFIIGDRVAIAGRAREMLVVDAAPGWSYVVAAWPINGRPVERMFHASGLVLLCRAGNAR